MGDHNDLGACIAGVELHDRLDRHALVAKAGADAADHAGGIVGGETHIVALPDGVALHQVASAPGRWPPAGGRDCRRCH